MLAGIEEGVTYVVNPRTGFALRVVPEDECAELPESFKRQVGQIGLLHAISEVPAKQGLLAEHRFHKPLSEDQLSTATPFLMEITRNSENGTFTYINARQKPES